MAGSRYVVVRFALMSVGNMAVLVSAAIIIMNETKK